MRRSETPALRDPALLDGLRELAESAFPKRCPTCGRTYETVQDYRARIAAGQPADGHVPVAGDDGAVAVDLYRNCECGAVLIDRFAERRDPSPQAAARRARFAELLAYLEQRGLERMSARDELLKVMRGIPSPLLRGIVAPRAEN